MIYPMTSSSLVICSPCSSLPCNFFSVHGDSVPFPNANPFVADRVCAFVYVTFSNVQRSRLGFSPHLEFGEDFKQFNDGFFAARKEEEKKEGCEMGDRTMWGFLLFEMNEEEKVCGGFLLSETKEEGRVSDYEIDLGEL